MKRWGRLRRIPGLLVAFALVASVAGGLRAAAEMGTTHALPLPTVAPGDRTHAYEPQAGTYAYFPASIFRQPLGDAAASDDSERWLAALARPDGTIALNRLGDFADEAGVPLSPLFPIYVDSPSNATYTIHCIEKWGRCDAEGRTVHLSAAMVPEQFGRCDGSPSQEDCHIALLEETTETDLWAVRWPPQNGVLSVGWGGRCDLAGTGYGKWNASCSATAINSALSLGTIRPADIIAALAGDGTLPYAISASVPCSNGHVAPFSAGGGHDSECPPLGARIGLRMSFEQIDAMPLSPIAKVLLRTMSRYGIILTDINGGSREISFQQQSDLSQTAVGRPGAWTSLFVPEAQREGIATPILRHVYRITVPYPGVDFRHLLYFTRSPSS